LSQTFELNISGDIVTIFGVKVASQALNTKH